MAGISPYAQPAQYHPAEPINTFIPLPYEAIMKAGAMKQNQQDENFANTSKLQALAGSIQAMPADEPHKAKVLEEYHNQIQNIMPKLKSSDPSAKYDIMELQNRFATDPRIQVLHANKQNWEAKTKAEAEMKSKGLIRGDYQTKLPFQDYLDNRGNQLTPYNYEGTNPYTDSVDTKNKIWHNAIQEKGIYGGMHYDENAGVWTHTTDQSGIRPEDVRQLAKELFPTYQGTNAHLSDIMVNRGEFGLDKNSAIDKSYQDFENYGMINLKGGKHDTTFSHADSATNRKKKEQSGGSNLVTTPGYFGKENFPVTEEAYNLERNRLDQRVASGDYSAAKELHDLDNISKKYFNNSKAINTKAVLDTMTNRLKDIYHAKIEYQQTGTGGAVPLAYDINTGNQITGEAGKRTVDYYKKYVEPAQGKYEDIQKGFEKHLETTFKNNSHTPRFVDLVGFVADTEIKKQQGQLLDNNVTKRMVNEPDLFNIYEIKDDNTRRLLSSSEAAEAMGEANVGKNFNVTGMSLLKDQDASHPFRGFKATLKNENKKSKNFYAVPKDANMAQDLDHFVINNMQMVGDNPSAKKTALIVGSHDIEKDVISSTKYTQPGDNFILDVGYGNNQHLEIHGVNKGTKGKPTYSYVDPSGKEVTVDGQEELIAAIAELRLKLEIGR